MREDFVIHGPKPTIPLPNCSLGRILYESLLSNPNEHEALIDAHTNKSISYRELLGKSCSLAESLLKSNYGPNTVMSICSENSLEFFVPVLSALYIGAIMAPLNHNYISTELLHTLNISKPKVIFCSKLVKDKFLALKSKLSYIEVIIVIDCDEETFGVESMNSFIERHMGSLIYRFLPLDLDPKEHVAFILCSSGTTGLPKGVMLTHRNISVRFCHSLDPKYVKPETNITTYAFVPFFHAYGLIVNLIAVKMNQKIVLIKSFEENLFLRNIEKYRITRMWLVPPLAVFLAKSPLVDKYDLSSIEEIACGAAPLSKETETMVKKRLKISNIRQGYGLTEATLAVIMMSLGEEKLGSSGKVLTYMSCKVRDPETGKPLGPGQVGELCFKGEMVMKGYYGNKEATRNSFTSDGWLLTGDLGYYDKDGFFYIVDRLKELIKYKGFQVAPAELEAILLTHPQVKDVGVVGLPDEIAGELPLAFVVKVPNSKISEKEIVDFVAERVSPQKRLRGGVVFLDEIPKNPSGKILRRELRRLLQKYKSKL